MAGTVIAYDPEYRRHDTGFSHPERPDRLEWIISEMEAAGMKEAFTWLKPQPVNRLWLEKIHTPDYLDFIESCWHKGRTMADDGETPISEASADIAMRATGGALAMVDAVMRGGFRNGISLSRPPGHHACADRAMGFCLYNHVAVAARYAQEVYRLQRIAIIDFDVHHGNGTQDIFYDDPSVFFVSIHQWPLYPGSGDCNETGHGEGAGSTLNCPLPAESGIEAYQSIWESRIVPALNAFRPELVLLSAGFDAHREDPLAGMDLEAEDYGTLTAAICEWAKEACQGRIVSILEGGYDRKGLATSVCAHLLALKAAAES